MAWNDITVSDEYKQLSPRGRARLKQRFFEESILPDLATVSPEGQEKAFNRFMETPDDTGEGLARSMLGSAARGFLDPLAAAPEVVGAFTGIEGLEDFGGDIRSTIEGAFPVNPAQEGFLTDVASVGGQVGQIVATGGGGAVAGAKLLGKGATEAAKRQAMRFGATAAQQTAMGSSAVAGGLERAEQLGLEGGDRLLRGAIAGGTELLAERLGGFATELGGVGKAAGFADTVESGFMKPIIRGIGTEAGEEGLAEAAGQATDIAMAPEAAPGMDLKNIGYAMLLGGVGGAAFGGIEAAITPRTKKAFDGTTDFIPSSGPPPGMTAEEAEEQDLLRYGNAGEIIGYVLPQAPVTAETIEAELPVEIVPAVAPLAQNVAATPEASATAAALQRIALGDTESGLTDAGMADATANLLTGIPMQKPLGGELAAEDAMLEGQPIEEDQATLEQQQPTETNVPLTQETLQQEQSRGQELQEPRELPILPAEQAAQAPEAITESPSVISDTPTLSDIAGNNEKNLNEAKEVIGPRVPGLEVVLGDEFGLAPISVSPDGKQLRVAPSFLSRLKKKFSETWEAVLDLIVDEEVFHADDITSRGGEDSAQTQWASEWNSATKEVKDLISKAYRGFNQLTDAQKGAELARMKSQAGRLGKITESASNDPSRKKAADDLVSIFSIQQKAPEAAVGAEAAELEQQKATLPVDGEGAMLQGGDVRQERLNGQVLSDEEVTDDILLSLDMSGVGGYFKKSSGNFTNDDVAYNQGLIARWESLLEKRQSEFGDVPIEKLSSIYQPWARKAIKDASNPLLRPFRPITQNKAISSTDFNDFMSRLGASKKERESILSTTPSDEFQYRVPAGKGTGRAFSSRTGRSYRVSDVNPILESLWTKNNKLPKVSATADVPTESLPATGQLTSGDVGVASVPEKPAKGMSRKDFLSGMAAKVKQATATQGALQPQDATPPPQAKPQPATPATQETKPQAAASTEVTAAQESTAAQPAAGETGDAGVAPLSKLQSYISTLSPKAQAAWTPERLEAAQSYYATGNESALEPLTATQRKIVMREGVSESDAAAYEAEQKRQFALRNPPAATDSQFLEDYNAYVNSLSDETLQKERESREEAPGVGDARYSKQQGDIVEAFHGTPEGGWTDFKDSERGLFFSDKQAIAEGYIYHRSPWLSKGKKPEVKKVGLSLGKNLEIDAGGARFDNIRFPGKEWSPTVFGNLPKDAISVEMAAKLAFEQGYDSITIQNVMDSVSRSDKRKSTIFVVKKADQVSNIDSIRYSKQLESLDKKYAELEKRAKSGDKAAVVEAERMVAEAAKGAGFDYRKWFHFSGISGFNEFLMSKANHIGHHFGSEDQSLSIENKERRSGNAKGSMFNVFLKIGKPLRVADGGDSVTRATDVTVGGRPVYNAGWGMNIAEALKQSGRRDLASEVDRLTKKFRFGESIQWVADEEASNQIRRLLIENGYDTLVYENISEGSGSISDFRKVETDDGIPGSGLLEGDLPDGYTLIQQDRGGWNIKGPSGILFGQQSGRTKEQAVIMGKSAALEAGGVYTVPSDSVIALVSSQIKSADPFTYSNDGKLIPLSQRFQQDSPDIRYSRILRSADGNIRRTGVKSTPARAARNSYIGVIPGVENTWLGTTEDFDAEFPDGYPFDSTRTTVPADTEALVAQDGRAFIFIDRVQVLDGDSERAEQHGTSPGVEAIKRLLRHESFIHRGFMSLPGPLKARFADFVASGVIPEAELDYLVNNGYPQYKGWRDNKTTEMLAAEEWLAQRVERMGRIPQSGPIASIMDWLRDVWRWLTGGETTDLDKLRNTMRAMHKALGALDPKQRIVMELPDMEMLRRSVAQTQQDQEYLNAVAAGDMETAQRMVDEAARGAGYNVGPVFHGTNSDTFTEFDSDKGKLSAAGRGFYFSNSQDVAKRYGDRIMRVFLRMDDPVVNDERGVLIGDRDTTSGDGRWIKGGFPGLRDGQQIMLVRKPNQIKSADPVVRDNAGQIIPLSQRFQSTSSDIRYSKVQRPDPILTQPSRTRGNVPQTTKPNAQRRSVSEIFEGLDGAVEIIPRQYFPMGSKEKGNEFSATDALLSWSKDLLKPYAEDIGGLIEFLAILRSDERLQNELKLGPRSGAVVMPFLAQEAANRANALGSTDMRNAFLMEYDALASAGGQNLWAFNIISRLPEFSSNTYSSTLDKTEEQNFAATVDKKTNGEKTVKDVIGNLPGAGEVAADNVSEGLTEERQISDKVLELGASVQGNPKLSERIRQVISDVLKRGFLLRAMEKLKGEARKSIIPDSNIYDSLTLEEMEAELARLDKGIADSIDFIENEVAKDTAKEKTPSDSAQRIINRIINKAKRKERKEGKPDPVEELYKADLKSPMNEADFIEKAVELGVEENVALELKNAIDLQLTAKALEGALGTLGSDIESNIKKANEQANKFQKRADALIDNIVNRMADPPLARDRKTKAVDPLQKAYRDQLKKPVSREEFIASLEKINVFDQTASLLFDAAEMERASREAISAARKLPKLPIETAKEIINKITTAAAKVPAKKKQPDAVRSLYRKHLKKPMSEAEFSAEAKAAGLDAATTKELYDAINLEIVAIEIQAQARAAERAQTKELKKAEREAEKYQNQAEAKINEVADALADPSLTQDKEKVVNPLTEIYQNQIKTPITEPQFVEQVVALGVDEETATLLFSIAAMDRQARIDIRVAREDLRRREMSEAQASKLIYAQEEELRQGSKDREPSKSGDSINKAFREQVVNPLSQEKFRERLDKLKVSQKLADRLYATAERVATDNERAEVYRKRVALLDVDSAALTRFVNDLRLKGKLTGEPIQWRDLLSLPVAHQDTVKAELLARVKRHEALRNLSTGEQQAIADALNTIWQRERRKVFQAMIKKADLMGVSKEDQEVIVDAMPALLKYINQGMLGTSAFYRAVGEKFGIAPISAEARKQVEEMAAKMQEKDLYSFERSVLAEKILKILQNNTQLSRAEILSSFWVTSVLSGGRTIFDMALGVLNGGFSIAKKMITATIETRSPKAAIEGLTAFGQGIWMGAQVAAKNLIRPEEGLLASRNPAVADYFDDGARGAGLTTGDKLLLHKGDKPKDKLRRGLGVWMSFFERLFSGLDHINSTATMMGTMRMAAAMNPKLYNAALTPTKQDYANALERAKLRLPDGSNAAQIRLAQSIIEDGQHILERGLDESFMSQWRQLVADSRAEGNTASYQEDPTGAGGLLYSMVRNITSGLEDKTKGYRDEARVALAEARKTGRGVATSAVNYFVASLGYLLGTQAQNLLGVRFMRFTGNKLNELISFIPVLGMARLQEKGMVSGENYTLRGQNVRANQVLGWMSAVIYFSLLKGLDEEDDEERGWIVNGSWENLTPERKSQLMSDGFKPNTVAFFDKDTGRWTSYNFVSWPFAGWMAAFGSVSDYKRLTPDKWNEKILIDKTMAAAYAGAFAITDISSLSSLTEMFGRSTYTTDPAEGFQKRVVKGAANYLGGFFPKTLKDVDAWFDETNYKPEETWEHFAKEVPFYRRNTGAPLRDIFYEPVQVSRTPWSRALQVSPDDPAYKALGRLNSRGIWLTPANPENRKVKRGGKLRDMTDEEANAYMAEVGKRYKEFVMKQGDRLLEMDVDRADELVSKYTARIREIAFKRAIATAGKAAIPSAE